MRRLCKVVLFVLLLTCYSHAEEAVSVDLSPHYPEVLFGYVLNSKFDSASGGTDMVQNATDAVNISVRYKIRIYKNFDLGLGVSMDSNRTFIGRSLNGVAIAYLNPVPNLTLMTADFFTFYNISDFYVMASTGTISAQGANFPTGFKSSMEIQGGVGWHASDSFLFELSYRTFNLASDYYEKFSQNGFLIRVGYSFR